MKNILSILTGLLIIGCAPKIQNIPHLPNSTPSAIPNLENTQNGISVSISDNQKIQEKIKKQQEMINSQKTDIEKAVAMAKLIEEKAKANELINKEEAFQLITQLNVVKQQNLFLEVEAQKLSDINVNQNKVLEQTKKEASETLKKLVAKENETAELRTQNEHLSKNLQKTNDQILTLTKEASSAKVYKNWVIGIVAAIVLYFLINVAIKYIKPI